MDHSAEEDTFVREDAERASVGEEADPFVDCEARGKKTCGAAHKQLDGVHTRIAELQLKKKLKQEYSAVRRLGKLRKQDAEHNRVLEEAPHGSAELVRYRDIHTPGARPGQGRRKAFRGYIGLGRRGKRATANEDGCVG